MRKNYKLFNHKRIEITTVQKLINVFHTIHIRLSTLVLVLDNTEENIKIYVY